MPPDSGDPEAPLSAEELAELEKPLHELLGLEVDDAPEELAPPIDEDLLRRFDRRVLSAADSRMVAQLIASYRSWRAAWAEVVRSQTTQS